MARRIQNPYETKKFKALQDKWYKKLESKGFEDIEDTRHADRPLKRWHGLDFKSKAKSPDVFLATQSYFQKASELLNTHTFDTMEQRRVWELHAEGLSTREIVRKLKEENIKASKTKIITIINQIASIAGIK